MKKNRKLIKIILAVIMLLPLLPSVDTVKAQSSDDLTLQSISLQDSNNSDQQNPVKLPGGGYSIKIEKQEISDANWKVKLTNLDWTYSVEPHFSLDFSSGEKLWGFIPIPSLKADLVIKAGVKGDFAIDFLNKNLNSGDINTRIDSNTTGLYSEKISDTILDYIPAIGFHMDAFLVGGATNPASVSGHLDNVLYFTLDLKNGIKIDYDPSFTFTSIIPTEPNVETFVYVGTKFQDSMTLGEIGWKSFTIGPLARGSVGYMAGGKAVATLHKDEWSSSRYLNDSVESIHSCTEEGKDGCVSATVAQCYDIFGKVDIDLTLPGIDYTVYDKTFDIDSSYRHYGLEQGYQSLTWKEKFKYGDFCEHIYYRVPVAVWADKEMTKPLSGVYVHRDGYGSIDSNVSKYAFATTGTNPTILDNTDGRVNLYLPYIKGKYIIVVDESNSDPKYKGMTGKAEMPSNMHRGDNEQVNIILESADRISLSVEKEWEIDLENKDRPESIDVLLQAQYYNTGFLKWNGVEKATLSSENNWSFTFEDLPKFEMTPDGKLKEIKYRIRELAPAEDDSSDQDDDDDTSNPISWIVDRIDGFLKPDDGPLAEDSARVIPSRWDLDNTHIWNTIKKQFTDWDQIWRIEPSLDWAKTLAKFSFFPNPTVDYKVDAYTTIVGDREEEHTTRYWVEYKTEGNLTKITNTAMLDVSIYKRWLMLGDAEAPDSVIIALMYRPNEKYRDFVGAAAEPYMGLWLPVLKPLAGDKLNLLSLVGLDTLAKFDIINLVSAPLAIGKAKAKTEDLSNPLTAWRLNFKIRKYGWLGVPGIPVELQAQELSSAIVTDTLKFLTGLDIPISLSFNPFSGDTYLTVPGKAYQIPIIDKDFERTANIINTWYSSDIDAETVIGGTKYWINDDESKRPDSLTIVVKDEGTEIGRVTINKNDDDNKGKNSWAWSLLSSDVKDGVELDPDKTYEISEEYPEGYQYANNYSLHVEGHDLFNTWTDTVKVVIHKEYDFTFISRTNYYPDNINFKVRDRNGDPVGNPEGYDLDQPYKLANTYWYFPNEQDITLYDSDDDITEPYTFKVDGLRNMDISGFTVEEQMSYTTHNQEREFLPAYSAPVVTYETDANGKKTAVYTFTVTNQAQRKLRIKIDKYWYNDDLDIRPESIDVALKCNGEVIKTVNLQKYYAEDNGYWMNYFTTDGNNNDMWYFDSETKQKNEYTIEELNIPGGYECTVTVEESGYSNNASELTFTMKNFYKGEKEKEYVSVTGTKSWDGSSSSEPESIKVNVISSSTGVVRALTVTARDNWSWNVTGLDRYDESGNEITYSVAEILSDDNYFVSYEEPSFDSETKTWTCNITNSSDKINIAVRKEWYDDDDLLDIRPESVKVRLYQVSEGSEIELDNAELNDENGWTHLFKLLPETDEEGNKVTYKVEEDPVEGYVGEVTGSAEEGFTIINRPDGRYFSIPVNKEWKNDADHISDRPSSVTVYLYRGEEQIQTLLLLQSDDWKGSFNGVLKEDEQGNPIEYTVVEDRVSGYGEAVVTGSAESGFTVTNTFNNTVTVTVKKQWQNYDGTDTEHTSVQFVLYRKVEGEAEGTAVYSAVQLLEADKDWTRVYEELPKYDNSGKKYVYYVQEDPVSGYIVEYRDTESASGPELTVINKPTSREIKVTKVWDDDNNATGARPQYAVIHLLANGERVLNTDGSENADYRKNIADGDVYFNVPAYSPDDSTLIVYTLEEEYVQGYVSAIEGDMGTGFTITNTLIRDSKNITVTKKWIDEDNKYSNRPEQVTVRLFADGIEAAMESMSENADGNWTVTFSNVPVIKTDIEGNQKAIVYTVTEDPVSGYESEVTGFVITNTMERIDVAVTKKWDDNDNEHGIRPDHIYAVLTVNGTEEQEYQIRLDESNSWTDIFTELPAYINGREADYSVTEDEVEGYIMKVSGNTEEGFEITNTYRTTTTDVTVEKIWEDDLDNYPEIIIILLSNKETEGSMTEAGRITLDGNTDEWKHVFKDMPVYADDDRVIKYSVEELPLDGFSRTYITFDTYYFTVHNWKEPNIASVWVDKVWDDNNNAEQRRPDSVVIELLKNGEATGDTLILNERNEWSGQFNDLERYDADNVEYVYSVREQKVEGYEAEITVLDDLDVEGITHYQITNKPGVYWVSFVDYDDTVLKEPVQYAYGTKADDIVKPAEPFRAPDNRYTYKFIGWYPEITAVTEDAVYKAVYERTAIQYKISYHLNGGQYNGSTEDIEETYNAGSEIKIHEAPTREGYIFLYWKGSEYQPGDSYVVEDNHVFEAQWQEITPPDDAPGTGDRNDLPLYIAIMTFSLFGMAFMLLVDQKNKLNDLIH